MDILIKGFAIVSCKTEVVVQHSVVSALVHTTIWQYSNRQCQRIVWICIEILVIVTNQRIAHGTISLSLIGRVLDLVLLRCSSILHGTQCREFQVLNRLVLQLALELRIDKIDINIVGFQLMQNIESCIVRMVISIWIERTRGVQRIRIWVDIKVTLHLSRNHIHILAQCTRSFLVTITTTTNNIE